MTAVRLVVVGTGTEIGKTHVACAILSAWSGVDRRVVGCKPIESGVVDPAQGDAAELEKASSGAFHVKQFHVKRPSPYRFAPAISPHLAAAQAGISIELGVAAAWVEETLGAGPGLVETAGGLFSPLGPRVRNFELARALDPCLVLLVAPDRLGVLHDVTAALGLASALGRPVDGVVLSAPAQADGSTGANATELARLGIADVVAEFPREAWASDGSRRAGAKVVAWADEAWARRTASASSRG